MLYWQKVTDLESKDASNTGFGLMGFKPKIFYSTGSVTKEIIPRSSMRRLWIRKRGERQTVDRCGFLTCTITIR